MNPLKVLEDETVVTKYTARTIRFEGAPERDVEGSGMAGKRYVPDTLTARATNDDGFTVVTVSGPLVKLDGTLGNRRVSSHYALESDGPLGAPEWVRALFMREGV